MESFEISLADSFVLQLDAQALLLTSLRAQAQIIAHLENRDKNEVYENMIKDYQKTFKDLAESYQKRQEERNP